MYLCADEHGKFTLEEGYPQASVLPCIAITVFSATALEEWNKYSLNLQKGTSRKPAKAEEIIDFLAENNVKAFLICTNFHAVSKKNVSEHRSDYILSAEAACKNHPQAAREAIAHYCEILKNLSLPDYVKAMLLIQLFENAIRGIVSSTKLYSSQDLQTFSWTCDIMSQKIHPIVHNFVHFQINCHSNAEPIITDDMNKLSAVLNVTNSGTYLDTTKMLPPAEFQSDDDFLGLKASDCIANFFPKLLKGSLKLKNLDNLKKLFSLPHSLELTHFDKDKPFVELSITETGVKILEVLRAGK